MKTVTVEVSEHMAEILRGRYVIVPRPDGVGTLDAGEINALASAGDREGYWRELFISQSSEVLRLRARIEAKVEALENPERLAEWTQHHPHCARVTSAERCSCGLDDAWRDLYREPV